MALKKIVQYESHKLHLTPDAFTFISEYRSLFNHQLSFILF